MKAGCVRRKALLVRVNPNMDVGDVVQIARAQAKKLFKTDRNVRVNNIIKQGDYEFIAVVSVVQAPAGACGKNRGQVDPSRKFRRKTPFST